MFRIILTLAICASVVGSVISQERTTVPLSPINEAKLRAHIKFLADDMLEGRGTGARGGELAAKYIAAQLEALGAKGAASDGSFFQPVSLVGVARDLKLRVSPDARPEQGSFYRSDHFPFAKAGVPSISLKEGNDYAGRPKGWGEQQFRAYNTAHYHQPSDEMRGTWDFRGMIQEAMIALAIGRRIADAPEKPRFNPDDEFAKKP